MRIRWPDVDVIDANVHHHEMGLEMGHVREPELQVRDQPHRALAINARVGHHDVIMTIVVKRSLEHRLPCRFLRQVELIRRAAPDGEDANAGRIESGTPKSECIASLDEFCSTTIEGSSGYGLL